MTTGSTGAEFVAALAAKDERRLRAVLAPDVDFKGLTPSRFWEAGAADEVIAILLGSWFEETDHIEAVLDVQDGTPVTDVERVGYRFAITSPQGKEVVEQQAYYRASEGRLTHLRVVCSGFQPR